MKPDPYSTTPVGIGFIARYFARYIYIWMAVAVPYVLGLLSLLPVLALWVMTVVVLEWRQRRNPYETRAEELSPPTQR
jgi:hypothetical protein